MSDTHQKNIPALSFVVPVYNEEQSVGILASKIKDAVDALSLSYEIIFIDDGSTDGTLSALRKIPSVTVIAFSRNFGKSQALQAGFDRARGEYIITLDGDLQDDPKDIPSFVDALNKGSDLVCGWKYKRKDSFAKIFFSKIANGITRMVTGTSVHDMNCGFKGYKKDIAQSLRLYGDMHRYIPSLVAGRGFIVTEVPVRHHARPYGESKYGVRRFFNSMFDFITLVFVRRFLDRPMHFFGFIGGVVLFFGTIILTYLGWIRLVEKELIGGRPLLLFGILLFLAGLQLLSLGFIGELLVRYSSKTHRYYSVKEVIHT